MVASAGERHHLDPDLIRSVIHAESGFNVRAVSPKGAQGLMQLMPGTASGLGVANAFDPQSNVEGGTQYLRTLLERYDFDLIKALAAYNAGPQRVEHYGGVPPFHETQAYVARIIREFNQKKLAEQKAAAKAARSQPQNSPKSSHSCQSRSFPMNCAWPRGSRRDPEVNRRAVAPGDRSAQAALCVDPQVHVVYLGRELCCCRLGRFGSWTSSLNEQKANRYLRTGARRTGGSGLFAVSHLEEL